MSGERDPLELLAKLVEARRAQFGDGPPPEEVLARVVPGGRPPEPRRRRLRRSLIAVALAVGVGGSGAVAWAVWHRERATSPATVQCLREADLNATSAVVSANGVDPLTRCIRFWDGRLDDWGPRPPLVACVSPTGAPVVMPGDDTTCQMLGIPNLDPTLTEAQARVVRMQEELGQLLLTSIRCVPPAEAAEVARDQLDKHQLEGWDVVIEGDFSSTAPCGVPGFDEAGETVYIQPSQDRTASGEGE